MNTYKRHRFPPDIISHAVRSTIETKTPSYGDTFYIDEVFVKINGKQHYLLRAVDQDGEVVDVYLQPKRDGAAAKRGGCGIPTIQIATSGSAIRDGACSSLQSV